jgi:hypothetical protein
MTANREGCTPTKNEKTGTNLRRFQDTGSADYLLAYIKNSKENPDRHEEVVRSLNPILAAVTFGWPPDYSLLDVDNLESYQEELSEIVTWMDSSQKVDLVAVGIALMGFFHYEVFKLPLQRHVASGEVWERKAAIEALAKFDAPWAAALVASVAANDPDQDVRAAARRVQAKVSELVSSAPRRSRAPRDSH